MAASGEGPFCNPPSTAAQGMSKRKTRDHGGGLDAAIAQYGGSRSDWIDLSTGINPGPFPVGKVLPDAWTALPDKASHERLVNAARSFWNVPDGAAILPAPGASALIARIPALSVPGRVHIETPTYNEHAAAFEIAGWTQSNNAFTAYVAVHPNNPDGRLIDSLPTAKLTVIDESFCDVMPERSLIEQAAIPGVIILKSFGKFWGLAGLRLGFAIGDPKLIAGLSDMLGPWPVSGIALSIGADALDDVAWAETTRSNLKSSSEFLDQQVLSAGGEIVGGTTLFRLYQVDCAKTWQHHFAQHHILTRIFPYSDRWIRFGLPKKDAWPRLTKALGTVGGATPHAASADPTAR